MKRILFDLSVCQPVGSSKYHGAGVYGCIVFRELVKRKDCEVIPYFDTTKFIDDSIYSIIEKEKLRLIDKGKIGLRKAVESSHVDCFYSPLFSPSYEVLYNQSVRGMVTVHGLRELEMNKDSNEYLYCASLKDFIKTFLKHTPYFKVLEKKYIARKESLFRASNFQIVTITNHSKFSIRYHYPEMDNRRIKVRCSPPSSIENYDSVSPYSENKYYLIISAGRWIKNSYRAIAAFEKLVEKGLLNDSKLIIVGLSKNTLAYKKIGNNPSLVFLDYVSRYELESLYKGAYALLYLSLNEGLGDPPLEAMKFGTPVIASSFGAISEVCGESVLYANPYSEQEIGIRLLELEDADIYKDYSEKARIRHRQISQKQQKDLGLLVDDIINL